MEPQPDRTTMQVGHYRRPLLGVPWVAGLVLIPAFLALLGIAMDAGRVDSGHPVPTVTGTPAAEPAPGLAQARLTVSVNGSTVQLAGTVPDTATRSSYAQALRGAFGSGVVVKDTLVVKTESFAAGTEAIDELARVMKPVLGVTVDVSGPSATLTGAAPSAGDKQALVDAIGPAFPGAVVAADRLAVGDPAAPLADCAQAREFVAVATGATKIHFATSGTSLTPESQQVVTRLAESLKSCSVKLEVVGNTDNVGTVRANERMSLARAEAVKAQLVDLGLSAEAITAVGHGSGEPIASNETALGRSLNRRVDIHVV